MRILSIDAWRESGGGWTWNNWFDTGQTISKEQLEKLDTNRKILNFLRSPEIDILSEYSKGRVSIDDDGYNIVICHKRTKQPIYAIEYGGED